MELESSTRITISFILAGITILLRMCSDWFFSTGGPLLYQMVQAAFLLMALLILWPHLDIVFLKGGDTRRAIREGLMILPLGFLLGWGISWIKFGGPQWPTFEQVPFFMANNLFFCAVEELEFRGFLLSFLLRGRMPSTQAIWLTAILHTLAHKRHLLQGGYITFGSLLLLTAYLGWLTCRTRSLWGAYIAHTSWNISLILLGV